MADKHNGYLHLGASQLDYGDSKNHKIISLSVHFNNISPLSGKALNKDEFYGYLMKCGFVTYRSNINKRVPYHKQKTITPIILNVSMDMGEFEGFKPNYNPDAKPYKQIKPATYEPHKVLHELDSIDTSEHGLARFLDSDYSVDTLINWLGSEGLDIPIGVYNFASEVKKWEQVPEPSTKAVGDNAAKKNHVNKKAYSQNQVSDSNDGKPKERQDYFRPIWVAHDRPKVNKAIWSELRQRASLEDKVIESVTGNKEFVFKYQDGSKEPLVKKVFQNDMTEVRKKK